MPNTKYHEGNSVELMDLFNGKITRITGKVMKVVNYGNGDQFLLIKGETTTGIPVETHTFSHDQSLKKIQPKVLANECL